MSKTKGFFKILFFLKEMCYNKFEGSYLLMLSFEESTVF